VTLPVRVTDCAYKGIAKVITARTNNTRIRFADIGDLRVRVIVKRAPYRMDALGAGAG
jgi:hypothetical protein